MAAIGDLIIIFIVSLCIGLFVEAYLGEQ